MKCLSIEQIYLYVEKELSAAQNKKIEQHLATCLKCKKALEERRLLLQAAESLPLWQTPPDFTQQVMARIFPAKVSLSAWLAAASAGFVSIVLALFFFFLVTGQNISGLLASFNQALWYFVRNISLISVKLLKLASLFVKLLQQFSEYLIKGFTLLTTIISPEVQIIVITITIILVASSVYGIRKKLLVGEKA